MSWIELLGGCLKRCCGSSGRETDGLTAEPTRSFQSTYTVRRISSFGQTVGEEGGDEEKEVPRHSSVVVYRGETAPWTSRPAPIQPGVTVSDIQKQAEKLAPIAEYSPKSKPKQRWKKPGFNYTKKEIEFADLRKNKHEPTPSVQLKSIKYNEGEGEERGETILPRDDMVFSKCSRRASQANHFIANYLAVHSGGQLVKSASSPHLADGESLEKSKKSNLKSFGQLSLSSDKKDLSQGTIDRQDEKDLEAKKLALEYGLDLTLYTKEALDESIKFISSVSHQCWQEDPIGTLQLAIEFNTLQKMLNITIVSIQSLSGLGLENEHFPTIIKLSLIGSKKYTKTSKRIAEEWRSAVKQYFSFLIKDMDFRSLRVSLFHADWVGKHDTLGYGLLSFQQLKEKTETIQLKLYSQPQFGTEVGMMQITFGFDGMMFSLTIHKIFNFDSTIRNTKIYIKMAYYSLSKKVKERTSHLYWTEQSGEDAELWLEESVGFRLEGHFTDRLHISLRRAAESAVAVFRSGETLGRVTFGPALHYQDSTRLTPWGLAIKNKKKYCYSFKISSHRDF